MTFSLPETLFLLYLNHYHQLQYTLKINATTSAQGVDSTSGFSIKVLGLRGLVVFPTTSCSSGWICFHWTGGFITCAKPCKRQFRCDRNAVKDTYMWSYCVAKRVCACVWREREVQECVCVCLIMSTLFIGMLFGRVDDYSHVFTAATHKPILNIAPWAHVGSVPLNFKVTTSARADQLSVTGSEERTEEFLSHEMKTHWHLQIP